MKIDIITIFPELYSSVFSESLIQKAIKNQICQINIHNLRDYCEDKHKQVDDSPYGGGPGMVFKPEPLHKILTELKSENSHVILTCPKGDKLSQNRVSDLAKIEHLIIIAAHYEGIDQRIIDSLVDQSISVGDFVLCGGELPSMIMSEAIIRLLPGVVGNNDSIIEDSFQNSMLDHPHYTRPANFLGQNVPTVLLSGNHSDINLWRMQERVIKTFNQRSDVFSCSVLNENERNILENYLKS